MNAEVTTGSESWVERVTRRAKDLNITDSRLADLVGVSRSTVSFWMNDHRVPNLEQKIRMAEALDVTLNWLDTGEDGLPESHLPSITMDSVRSLLDEMETARLTTPANSAPRIVETNSTKSFVVMLDNDTMIDPGRGDTAGIPKGARLQIDADHLPESGAIILVEHEGSIVLRRWQRLGANVHDLRVLNPMYQQLNFTYNGDIADVYCGTAMGFSVVLQS